MNIKKRGNLRLIQFYKNVINYFRNRPDSKAALSLFILFAVFLAFSLLIASHLMELKTANTKLSYEKIKKFVDEYNSAPVENIILPDSRLVAGNPNAELKIIVFTDFLCSFCYKFFEVEEYLLERFKDRIKIEYHSFPLDRDCNATIQRTIYNNSCIASAAMIASAEQGLFSRYSTLHFHNYKSIKAVYNKEIAARLLNYMGTATDTGRFIKIMDSQATAEMIKNDIALAGQYKINATPTIFIGNKRITGARQKEEIEAIIEEMLK